MKIRSFVAALAGGLAFYLLFLRENPGINVTLWFLLLMGLTHLTQPHWLASARGRWAALALLVVLVECLLIDSHLAFLTVCAATALVVGSLALPAAPSVVHAGLAALRRQVFTAPRWFFVSAWQLSGRLPVVGRVFLRFRMIYIVPVGIAGLLLLFLVGASPVFAERVGSTLTWLGELLPRIPDLEELIIFGIMLTFGTAITAAFVAPEPEPTPTEARPVAEASAEQLEQVHRVGLVTLALVNALLLLYNINDIEWIWVNFYLPEGVPLSQLVHEGTYFLIASILLAIGCLFTLFRPRYAALKGRSWLVAGALLWLVQNGVLVASVVVRNARYIDAHGLAYKRIGVLFFLVLVLSGLATLAYFIQRRQTVGYLLRVNGIVATLLWLGAAAVDWDGLILRHNLAKLQPGHFDTRYHFALSDHQLPLLLAKESYIEPTTDTTEASVLVRRAARYLYHADIATWLSWNPRSAATYQALKAYKAAHPERFERVPQSHIESD